jgi:hypothetical protein
MATTQSWKTRLYDAYVSSGQAGQHNKSANPVEFFRPRQAGFLNYLTLWPTGQTQPYVSTLNSDGRVKANAAIVLAGATNASTGIYFWHTFGRLSDTAAGGLE